MVMVECVCCNRRFILDAIYQPTGECFGCATDREELRDKLNSPLNKFVDLS